MPLHAGIMAFNTSTPITLNLPNRTASCSTIRTERPLIRCVASKRPASKEGITTFDELVVDLWKRVSGKNTTDALVNTPITSFGPSDGVWRYLLSTTLFAKIGKEKEMASLLQSLQSVSVENGVLFRAVNQDPQDRTVFMVIEHFGDQSTMKKYQKSEEYQIFVRNVQTILEKPMGVHLSKERDGQISSGYYPFGPGGEGGRDDMVFR